MKNETLKDKLYLLFLLLVALVSLGIPFGVLIHEAYDEWKKEEEQYYTLDCIRNPVGELTCKIGTVYMK